MQRRLDKINRQWLTRLYYLAHSPYQITWALDSNVISCTPGAAQAFLDAALASHLWGYHIAHASQNLLSNVMYPHNFNIISAWGQLTSDLLREWFLTALSEGVASDDQKTLHIAELRLRARDPSGGLVVGRVAPEYGAAFYDVMDQGNATRPPAKRPDRIRITPLIRGTAHVLHTTNATLCHVFNGELVERQLLVTPAGREMVGGAMRTKMAYILLKDARECTQRLDADRRCHRLRYARLLCVSCQELSMRRTAVSSSISLLPSPSVPMMQPAQA